MFSLPRILTLLSLICLVALTGCVNREQADARLARACAAGVTALMPEGSRIDRVSRHRATASPVGPAYRHITITGIYVDGWLEDENEYECTFEESFGFLNSGYTASIYQVKIDDMVIGGAGGDILGDAQDFIKLTNAVRKSLYEE